MAPFNMKIARWGDLEKLGSVQLTWRGVDDVLKRLDSLPRNVVAQCLKPAIDKSSRLVLRAMKSFQVLKRTGMLKASLGVRVSPNWRQGRVYAVIGPRRRMADTTLAKGLSIKTLAKWRVKKETKNKKLEKINPTRYAHLVEKGHKKGKGKSGARAFPFMRPAWQSTKLSAEQVAANEIRKSVAKLAN